MDFAFVGCGRVAPFHAEVVSALGHRVSAASARPGSPNIEAFGRAYGVARLYDDWRRMLGEERPDAVVVVTPWNETQTLIADVVTCGAPCLVEKPVALDARTLAHIIADVDAFLPGVRVGYNRRFYESVTPVREALDKWPLVSIELTLPEAISAVRGTHASDIVRHMLVYMSSHWFDLLRFLVGEVTVLEVYARRKVDLDYATAYHGLLWSTRFGVPIHLRSNFDAPARISIDFDFEDRIYRLSPIETLTVYRGLRREPSAGGRLHRFEPEVEQVVHVDATYKPGFYRQMEDFVATCASGSAAVSDGCTLADALAVTKLLEEIQTRSRWYS